MFKFHKKVEYALTALKYMKTKSSKELVTAKEICGTFSLPFDPTSRVLQIMAQKGLLEAVQGAYGGYRLVGDLSAINLYELSREVAGPLAISDCTSGKGPCARSGKCIIKDPMGRLNTRLIKVFKDIPVSEMV